MDTGKSPPTNNDLKHLSSEDLYRIIGVSATELAHRSSDTFGGVLEDLAREASEGEEG